MSSPPSILASLSLGDPVAVVSPDGDPRLAVVVSATSTRVRVGVPERALTYRRDTGGTYPASAGESRVVLVAEAAAELTRVDRLRLCALRRVMCLNPAAMTDAQVAGVLSIVRELAGPDV